MLFCLERELTVNSCLCFCVGFFFCVCVCVCLVYQAFVFLVFWYLGVDIVCKALRMPALTIAKNAGVDAHVVVEKVLNEKGDVGYDALNDRYINLFEGGIVDPTKVVYICTWRLRAGCRASSFSFTVDF